MVPGRAVPDLLPSLLQAFDLPVGEERFARIHELVRSSQVATSLAEVGAPDAALGQRIPLPPAGRGSALPPASQPFVSRAPSPRLNEEAPAVQGEHGDYETPRANAAYLFSPFSAEYIPVLRSGANCHGGPIMEAAERHNYYVYQFDGAASSLDEFLASSGDAGIMWVCMHGGNAFEIHGTKGAAVARAQELRDRGIDGIWVGSHPGALLSLFGKRWYVSIRQQTVRAHWRGAETIFHSEGCDGQNFAPAFIEVGVREFIGLFGKCFPGSNGPLNREFWSRLDGTIEEGRERPVGTAFEKAFAGTPFELAGSGGGMTVLSPAVRNVEPKDGEQIAVPGIFEGRVHFDAKMDALISLPRIIELDGCDATIVDTEWLDAYTLRFRYRANTPGDLMLSVQSQWASTRRPRSGPAVQSGWPQRPGAAGQ